jgi:hypothetical protein
MDPQDVPSFTVCAGMSMHPSESDLKLQARRRSSCPQYSRFKITLWRALRYSTFFGKLPMSQEKINILSPNQWFINCVNIFKEQIFLIHEFSLLFIIFCSDLILSFDIVWFNFCFYISEVET